jgi:cytoskeletal protein CcmA (bactofilin family)
MIHFPSIDKFDLVIGTGVSFQGDIHVDGRVSVSGQVKGSIEARDLRVEPGGRIDGQVRVNNLEVKGSIGQDVSSTESVLVHSTGLVHGRLRCVELEIERGGRVTGQIIRLPA